MTDSSLRRLSFCGREGAGADFFGFAFRGATFGFASAAGGCGAAGGDGGCGVEGGGVLHAERNSTAMTDRGNLFIAL